MENDIWKIKCFVSLVPVVTKSLKKTIATELLCDMFAATLLQIPVTVLETHSNHACKKQSITFHPGDLRSSLVMPRLCFGSINRQL